MDPQKTSFYVGFTSRWYSEKVQRTMVSMATPWRDPQTGTFYLRRQIPAPLQEEYGGRQLWKRSLETKDPDEARRVFLAVNAELEALFAQARSAIADRAVSTKLTAQTAAEAVARISASERGSRSDRFPVLANVFWSKDAAASIVPGARPMLLADATMEGLALLDPEHLAGDLWIRVVRTRARADALFMAEHMILWVHGAFRGKRGAFGDLVRSTETIC